MITTKRNFIPDTVSPSPDYYCTWQTQLYATSDGKPEGQRRCLSEKALFHPEKPYGWTGFYPQARKDLIFVMDDSWDVPSDGNTSYYGSLQLAPDKFPDAYSHPEPLKYLSKRVRALGWKGLGGWVCAQESPLFPASTPGDYWKARLQESEAADFTYWKVDWGKKCEDPAFREKLTQLGKVYAPHLIVEHAMTPSVIPHVDCFRTYDVPAIASIPLTMEKLAAIPVAAHADAGCAGLINCEDEVYIAAAGGYTMGVMRHPYCGVLPNGSADPSFPALHRQIKTKMYEVLRATRWHRIAPAFDAGYGITTISEKLLTDFWKFEKIEEEIELWWFHMPLKERISDDTLSISAPAAIARNTGLPDVQPDCDGYIPYVVCSCNPNGVYSIATAGRTLNRSYKIPKCHVAADTADARTLGIFGEYASLTLKTCHWQANRIYMQDLASDHAFDVTADILRSEGRLTVPGKLIAQIGTAAQPVEDTSEPGVVLILE